MGVSNSAYDNLANTSVSWYCTNCNRPNHSTLLYDLSSSVANRFSSLQPDSFNSIISSIDSPTATSSPRRVRNKPQAKAKQGLRTLKLNFRSVKNKVPELDILLESTSLDIIIGTETWTNNTMHPSEFYSDKNTIYRRDRGTDDHGGVVIATMNNLTTTEINKSKIVELISVKIDLPNKKTLIVSSFYRPPKTDEVYIQNYIKEISELKTRHDKAIFCIGGDFNLPDIDWKTGLE